MEVGKNTHIAWDNTDSAAIDAANLTSPSNQRTETQKIQIDFRIIEHST